MQDQPTFEYDETGKITGYKTKVGADTVFPFSGGKIVVLAATTTPQGTWKTLITAQKDYKTLYVSGAPLGFYKWRKNNVNVTPDKFLTDGFTATYSFISAFYDVKIGDIINVYSSGVGTYSLTAFVIE